MSHGGHAARAIAAVVLPGIEGAGRVPVEAGSEHLVVVAAGVGVVRIAKAAHAAALMDRRARLLDGLCGAGPPFVVPEPLGEVVTVDGHTALALSWVPGSVHPRADGDPAVLARVLRALHNVDLAALDGLLDQPPGYAGGARWAELMGRAVEALPADAACLGWHGCAAVAVAVNPTTYRRACIWHPTSGSNGSSPAGYDLPGHPTSSPAPSNGSAPPVISPEPRANTTGQNPDPDQGPTAPERRARTTSPAPATGSADRHVWVVDEGGGEVGGGEPGTVRGRGVRRGSRALGICWCRATWR